MQSGVTNEEIEVDLRLSVIKLLHATWLVSLYNHLTSCEGTRHTTKRWEKASIASVFNVKKCNSLQRIPSKITSLSRPVRQFLRLSVRLLFLYCAHLLNILSYVLSTELYDTHCIDSIHSKQLFFVSFIRFHVGQL